MVIPSASKLTAVGAVVVGSDEECGVRVDRLAVEGQIFLSLYFYLPYFLFINLLIQKK